MASFYTVKQVRELLDGSIPANVDVVDAINQMGDYAYSLGRWADSKKELLIPSGDIFQETTSGHPYENDWFLDYDADLYAGAIAFQVNNHAGFKPVPITVLYDNPAYAWSEFVDMDEVEESAGDRRKYKLPHGVNSSDNILALVKKKWQLVYDDADEVRIQPLRAIKMGIKAVALDYNNEFEKAQLVWQAFENALLRGDKQHHGPKKARISWKAMYNVRPSNFQ